MKELEESTEDSDIINFNIIETNNKTPDSYKQIPHNQNLPPQLRRLSRNIFKLTEINNPCTT